MTYDALTKELKAGKLAPVYFLYGEEDFYIDRLAALIEEKALTADEKSFNMDVFYGADLQANAVLAAVRSFPMMAQRRLVLVKEAQRIKKNDWDTLATLIEKQVPTTVLAFMFRKKEGPDMRTKFGKALKSAVVFEAKPLYDNQAVPAARELAAGHGLQLDADTAALLVELLGPRLHLLDNELAKLRLYLMGSGRFNVQAADVYACVNVDREFNVWELQNKLADRDRPACHRIIHYMTLQEKENPAVMVVASLYAFYSRLAIIKQKNLTRPEDAAAVLKISPFQAKKLVPGARSYQPWELARNLKLLSHTDHQLKGIQYTKLPEDHILKTLVYQLVG